MRLRLALGMASLVLLTSLHANAQTSDNEKKGAARAAYLEGVDFQEHGKIPEALADFEKAQKLFDAPTHLLHIAQCQAQLGKLVEASETYETLSHKTLEKGAPDAFKTAQDQGNKDLEALKPRIPTLRVSVKPEPATLQSLQIHLNDKQMPIEMIGIARPINPGTYKITATATGYGTREATTLEIREKDAKSIDLTLEKGASGGATVGTDTVVKPKTEPTDGPTQTGLLLGVRPQGLIPFGNVDKNTKFKEYAGAGVGVGIDIVGRVAQRILVGGTIEAGIMNGPDLYVPSDPDVMPPAVKAQGGFKAKVSARTEYFGLLVGFMPNVDKFTPVGFLNGGYRYIQRSVTLNVGDIRLDDDINGIEAGIHAGVSFPAGPMRVVPLLNFDGGQFNQRDCVNADKVGGSGPTPGALSATCTSPDGGIFFMLGLSVGVYYHLDFGPAKTGSAGKIKNLTHFAF